MPKKGQHVVPNGGRWSVKKSGGMKASSTHSTQAQAQAAATTIAKNQKTELYIHGRDGRIRAHESFTGDKPGKKK